MSEQTPIYFVDLPTLPRKRYGVVVVEITDTDECMQPVPFFNKQEEQIGSLACEAWISDVNCCDYCGLPTCQEHIKIWRVGNGSITLAACKTCAALPPDVRDMVRQFREQVNR